MLVRNSGSARYPANEAVELEQNEEVDLEQLDEMERIAERVLNNRQNNGQAIQSHCFSHCCQLGAILSVTLLAIKLLADWADKNNMTRIS